MMGVSSAVASSDMVGMMCGGEADREQEDDLRYPCELSDENGMKTRPDAVRLAFPGLVRFAIC